MHPRHDLYIRPLLQTNKSDILQWLQIHKIAYAIDASNESSDYLRNRIRTNIIPALSQCDERWSNNFLATISRLKEDDALLNDIAQSTLNKLTSLTNNPHTLDVSSFISTHPSLRHRIIVLWLIQNNVQFPVTQSFLDEIIRFLSHQRGGNHIVHNQWSIIKKQGKAWIVKKIKD
jgi:tRNA(Ile)-lysidine synthase TilS/MesJ